MSKNAALELTVDGVVMEVELPQLGDKASVLGQDAIEAFLACADRPTLPLLLHATPVQLSMQGDVSLVQPRAQLALCVAAMACMMGSSVVYRLTSISTTCMRMSDAARSKRQPGRR